MKQKESSGIKDSQLLENSSTNKSSPILDATLIGVMIGIIIWGVAKNNLGFFTLIPLYFVYKLLNKPKTSTSSKDDVSD